MPTSGSVISFNQTLPIYADKKFIANTFKQVNINLFLKMLLEQLNFICHL